MKDKFKKILLALVMSLAMLSLFGCGKQSEVEPMTPETGGHAGVCGAEPVPADHQHV